MTDSEKERQDNLRLAYEEANRWLRSTENYGWVVSSLALTGTGVAIKTAIGMRGEDWKVILIGFAIILSWIWLRWLLNGVLIRTLHYWNYANSIEKELKINLLPDDQNNNQELPNIIFPKNKIAKKFRNIKQRDFPVIMIYASRLVWTICGILMLEYLIKLCCGFNSALPKIIIVRLSL